MVTIMVFGTPASIDDLTWTCEDEQVLKALEAVPAVATPSAGDYDYATAQAAIKEYGGKIVSYTPPAPEWGGKEVIY